MMSVGKRLLASMPIDWSSETEFTVSPEWPQSIISTCTLNGNGIPDDCGGVGDEHGVGSLEEPHALDCEERGVGAGGHGLGRVARRGRGGRGRRLRWRHREWKAKCNTEKGEQKPCRFRLGVECENGESSLE